jgi:hypothetical protein
LPTRSDCCELKRGCLFFTRSSTSSVTHNQFTAERFVESTFPSTSTLTVLLNWCHGLHPHHVLCCVRLYSPLLFVHRSDYQPLHVNHFLRCVLLANSVWNIYCCARVSVVSSLCFRLSGVFQHLKDMDIYIPYPSLCTQRCVWTSSHTSVTSMWCHLSLSLLHCRYHWNSSPQDASVIKRVPRHVGQNIFEISSCFTLYLVMTFTLLLTHNLSIMLSPASSRLQGLCRLKQSFLASFCSLLCTAFCFKFTSIFLKFLLPPSNLHLCLCGFLCHLRVRARCPINDCNSVMTPSCDYNEQFLCRRDLTVVN